MKFTKMQGLGNDYVYVNCFEEKIENPPAVARYVSDRHFGSSFYKWYYENIACTTLYL